MLKPLTRLAVLVTVTLLAWRYEAIWAQNRQSVEALMSKWDKEIRDRLAKDPVLNPLAEKYPFVLLHSQQLYDRNQELRSAYSFTLMTNDQKSWKKGHLWHLFFHADKDLPRTFDQPRSGVHNIFVDLGNVEFTKDPDFSQINIDHPGIRLFNVEAIEGHVYLMQIRDYLGNDFHVLFQVVAVDKDSRYMAFLWRKLPGGKVQGGEKK